MLVKPRLSVTLYVHRPSCSLAYIFFNLMRDDGFCILHYVAYSLTGSVVVIDSVFGFPGSEIFIYSKMYSKFVHFCTDEL
jgi:hypothetical protein